MLHEIHINRLGGKNKENAHNTAAYWKWNLKHLKLENNISFKISEKMD